MEVGSGGFLNTKRIVTALGVTPGMEVADLGCGSGYFTLELAQVVGSAGMVSAVDVMEEPLQAVQTKAEGLGLGNIRTIRADLEVRGSTGLHDHSQDVVLLANVLFQSRKREAMVGEAIRILKPGGMLVLMDWRKDATGFGPPEDMRIAKDELRDLAEAQGMKFNREIDAGRFYNLFVFQKP